jgi:predicted RNA methylase
VYIFFSLDLEKFRVMYIEHKKTERVITTHQKALPNAPLAVELFAGVGGFFLGMKAAGIDVALAVDSDEQTLATYRSSVTLMRV